VKRIAAEVPTTMDELATFGLSKHVLQTYGKRLLKNVNAYIESNNLQSYLENRTRKKLCPVTAAVGESILPDERNKELIGRIKKLIGYWADEVCTNRFFFLFVMPLLIISLSHIYLVVISGTNEWEPCIL
jgi:hypothetical protein